MPTFRALSIAVLACGAFGVSAKAQTSLPIALFERYVESLRQQVGIPGMSAAILQDGRLVWDGGFGHQDVEGLVKATADTPYPILDLTQTISSAVLLRRCMEEHYLALDDQVVRWDPGYSDGTATIAQLLSHSSPAGFKYDPSRFGGLRGVMDQCASRPYSPLLAEQVLDRFGMTQSLPGMDLLDSQSPDRRLFPSATLDRYAAIGQRIARPYRVDSRGVPTRAEPPKIPTTASSGVVSTVRDLARFDAALGAGALLTSETLARAWTPASSLPTGLGWFVQRHNGETVVWHFGVERNAYSALIVKLPNRDLTLIMLANSDGLAGPPYNLADGSVTSNLFASLFLRLFLG